MFGLTLGSPMTVFCGSERRWIGQPICIWKALTNTEGGFNRRY